MAFMATLTMIEAQCQCPPVPPGPWEVAVAEPPSEAPPTTAIECAYPDGACVWDEVNASSLSIQFNLCSNITRAVHYST